jgi:hypothetical protein
MPATDDAAVAALLQHDRASTAREVQRRIRHVDDCVMTRERGFASCGLRYCGAAPNRLCGEDWLTMQPAEPVRGLLAV